MTLKELQKVLGEQIKCVRSEGLSPAEKQDVYTQSEYVAKLAKQMINNADVILRYEVGTSKHMVADNSVISELVE